VIKTKAPQRQLFYAAEEMYVPPSTSFYARLNKAVGSWSKLSEPLRGCFCQDKNGRPVDPVVYLKIYIVGYIENIVWDTDLAARIADSFSIREFLGYGPTEMTPDHCSISRTRNSFGEDKLQEVLDKVVALCGEKGLIGGEVVCADTTLNKANVSLSSLRHVQTGATVSEHLKQVREAGEKLKVDNESFRSKTDPEARITKKATSPRGMYYKTAHVTDSKSQVILAVETSTADTCEVAAVLKPMEDAKRRLESQGKKPQMAVLDAGFDDAGFHREAEKLGYTPLTNYRENKSSKPEEVQKGKFLYDAERDLYTCPNGCELMRGHSYAPKDNATGSSFTVYYSNETDCASCPLKTLCLSKDSTRRSISRHAAEESRQQNIARCHTDEGRALLKKRKEVSEPPFGHMKRLGGLIVVNCRTLKRARVKLLAAAITWNIKKLVKTVPVDLFFAWNCLKLLQKSVPLLLGNNRKSRLCQMLG